jgi:hypothetical protein
MPECRSGLFSGEPCLGGPAGRDRRGDRRYARWVINEEWDRLEQGSLGNDIYPWGAARFQTFAPLEPDGAREEDAHGKWMDHTSDRKSARLDRIQGADGVMPTPLWIALFLISAVVFVFMLFFADRRERAAVQAVLMGGVVAVITTLLLLLNFLDDPYHEGIGGLEPRAMRRTVQLIDEELAVTGLDLTPPCNDAGRPL